MSIDYWIKMFTVAGLLVSMTTHDVFCQITLSGWSCFALADILMATFYYVYIFMYSYIYISVRAWERKSVINDTTIYYIHTYVCTSMLSCRNRF